MTDIAKIDFPAGSLAGEAPAHPSLLLWTRPVSGLLDRVQAEMNKRRAHPARTLVLLPYAQLMPLASRLWAQVFPDGFAPRFETTLNWSSNLEWHTHGATDISFDMALDSLTASALLRGAGLGAQQDALAGLLVQAAHGLGPLAAACHPSDRAGWAQEARKAAMLGLDSPVLAMEAVVSRIAVEWAAQSSYASDLLFDTHIQSELECLLLVQGFIPDPMVPALQEFWGARLSCMQLAPDRLAPSGGGGGQLAWHACQDGEDEAQRTAACAVRHIAAGRVPVALVSTDRALTRRVRTMLESAGVQIRDENGWKLSTSHSAAKVMSLLKAAVWNASTDAVLAWLKAAPVFADRVMELEIALRRDQTNEWRQAGHGPSFQKVSFGVELQASLDALRERLQGSRSLPGWLHALRDVLQDSGMWDAMLVDDAGVKVLAALRLTLTDVGAWERLVAHALWSTRRMDLAEFTNWVSKAMEGASFSPAYPQHEQLVILPMSQMLARPFAAAVLAGCDEVRLNPSPEPAGGWTAPQRAALGLPSRKSLEGAVAAAWHHALQTPLCDILWRRSDDTGETLLPSALVQKAQIEGEQVFQADDPRVEREVSPAPVLPPHPSGQLLPVSRLSASAYEDLRNCPYRFFALRQLGLQSVEELEAVVDKRDFGLWLHDVLKRFHQSMAQLVLPGATETLDLINHAAVAATQAMHLGEGEFLPFAAAWPTIRDGYLRWLAQHQATGAVFASAETAHTQRLRTVELVGRIDRIDRLGDGGILVLDYKTESIGKTAARIKEPLEDTQIAFYAALLPHDTLHAAYVNVGERDGTKAYPQLEVVQARDALIEGILDDMDRIAQGAPMDALGEGTTCEFCQARGLCRKDFWI